MMKTLMRALIILVAALVVVGATVAAAQQTGALASDGGDRPQFDGGQTDFGQASSGAPGGFLVREGESGEGGWAELAKNVGVVGVLVVGAVLVTKGLKVVGRSEAQSA
jgi:hypothetical protein